MSQVKSQNQSHRSESVCGSESQSESEFLSLSQGHSGEGHWIVGRQVATCLVFNCVYCSIICSLVLVESCRLSQFSWQITLTLSPPPHSDPERQVFKSKFSGWDDVIAVDFTRTAESVRRTGADINAWAKKQQTKTDLSALFTPRQVSRDRTGQRQVRTGQGRSAV